MLTYKTLELTDKIWIDEIVEGSNVISSEHPFVSNFLWNDFLALELVDNKNFFSVFSKKKQAYLFPIFKDANNINEKQKEVIGLLKEDAKTRSLPLKLYGITPEMKLSLENLFPGKFKYIVKRDTADYIYKIEDLVHLKGKKYHSKRNFINSFKNNYNGWEYKVLKKCMFEECLNMNLNWYGEKLNNPFDDVLSYEVKMLNLAFKYFNELGLFGGAITLNKKIIGFSLGYKINNSVVDNIIEKALVEYKGVYNILLQQFLEHLQPNYIYVNREEDLGLENLKRAKLSLHPYNILNKYEALWL